MDTGGLKKDKHLKIAFLITILIIVAYTLLLTNYPNHFDILKGVLGIKEHSQDIGRSIASTRG